VNKLSISLLLTAMTLGIASHASAQTTGLTRAEVRQQLIQAEAQGLVPTGPTDYPPSARTIERNKASFAEQHEADAHKSADYTAYGGATESHTSY
jgi:hypothetical protein